MRWHRHVAVICLAAVLVGCNGSSIDVELVPADSEPDAVAGIEALAAASGIEIVGVDELPPEAGTTLELIEQGGPFPYSADGSVFHNYERLLPEKVDGYYHEYTVETSGSLDRGARRVVAGANGEYYYTDDHYRSFRLVAE